MWPGAGAGWRMQENEELADVVSLIRTQRIRWMGHIYVEWTR